MNDGTFCLPANVTVGQMQDVVENYLREHPENRHFTAASLIADALQRKFPCN
jgi:hypothetical protein